MKLRTHMSGALLMASVGVISMMIAAAGWLNSTSYYSWQQKRMVKRVLRADPAGLLSAGRKLLEIRTGFVGEISPASADVPAAIRELKPTQISVSANSLLVDFSDVFNPFGIIVYAKGAAPPPAPNGPRLWIEDLWVYDDGQLAKYRQQVGPANGSQPM